MLICNLDDLEIGEMTDFESHKCVCQFYIEFLFVKSQSAIQDSAI